MAQNLFRTVQRLLSEGGAVEPGATIEVYQAGTTTPLTLYSDRGLSTSAGSSVTADSTGAVAERWIGDGIRFKLVYKNAAGATVYTRDYANDGDTGALGDGWADLLDEDIGAGWSGIIPERAPYATIEQYGGSGDGVVNNTTAYNAWLAAVVGGSASKTLVIGVKGFGSYLFSTKPNRIENIQGINIQIRHGATVLMGFSGSTVADALFHFYEGSSFWQVEGGGVIGTADNGSAGGSFIRAEATSTAAPSGGRVDSISFTSFASVSALTISAVSNASEGVFTSAGHSYSAGQHVTLNMLAGGTFDTLNEKRYTIAPSPTTDTFKLYAYGTTNYVDTTSLGSYSASSGTVKRALCADAPISIDGTAKTSAPQGVRVTDIMHCTVFGGGLASIHALGYRALSIHGGNISSSGWVGRPYLSGTASVEGQNAILSTLSFPGLNLDRADETNYRSANKTGTVTTTGNTGDIYHQILLDNTTANQGVVVPSGTQDITITKAAPAISMVESDNSNVITQLRAVAGALNIEVDPTGLASGSVIYGIADGVTALQVGASEIFVNVPVYPGTDDGIDLGKADSRYDDVFATNGTIQTSDERIKQDVAEFTPTELRAAGKIAKLIRTYRMISAVEEKGDDARIHTGLIAQRVAEALESEGLDPWRYAFMCRDLIEWQDPLFGQRAAVADAENRLPETEAALADAIAQRDAELSAASDHEAKSAVVRKWAKPISELEDRIKSDRQTAAMNVPPAPAWFEPYERMSLRYGEISLWLIASQEARLSALEMGVQP